MVLQHYGMTVAAVAVLDGDAAVDVGSDDGDVEVDLNEYYYLHTKIMNVVADCDDHYAEVVVVEVAAVVAADDDGGGIPHRDDDDLSPSRYCSSPAQRKSRMMIPQAAVAQDEDDGDSDEQRHHRHLLHWNSPPWNMSYKINLYLCCCCAGDDGCSDDIEKGEMTRTMLRMKKQSRNTAT
mmetsp:Transcript_20992/g.30869  ORF Transcript_20992/g.30869 Transcript_20992/m.30869 type:complete len:180 (+) Transcript_20992:288-827(+)